MNSQNKFLVRVLEYSTPGMVRIMDLMAFRALTRADALNLAAHLVVAASDSATAEAGDDHAGSAVVGDFYELLFGLLNGSKRMDGFLIPEHGGT